MANETLHFEPNSSQQWQKVTLHRKEQINLDPSCHTPMPPMWQVALMSKTTLHIVGGATRTRAEVARASYTAGCHAELYCDLSELIDSRPDHGIVIVAEDGSGNTARLAIIALSRALIPLPVIVVAERTDTDLICEQFSNGALDYLALPIEQNTFRKVVERNGARVTEYISRKKALFAAKAKLDLLTRREREVLDMVAYGQTAKEVAETLNLSWRTVECHKTKILRRLQVPSMMDAAGLVLTYRLLRDPDHMDPELGDLRDAIRMSNLRAA